MFLNQKNETENENENWFSLNHKTSFQSTALFWKFLKFHDEISDYRFGFSTPRLV